MQEAPSADSVDLDGSRTIRNAEDTRSLLMEALKRPSPTRLDCSATDEADLSFLQLLLSARKSAEAAGRTLTLSHPASAPFLTAASRAGFAVAPDPLGGKDTYWLIKEDGHGQENSRRG
jgi:hypothetical protein